MDQHDWLAEQFEANRPHLRSVAYRMLGSLAEADDAVQESWLHLSRAGTSGVKNLGGWLTTIVARVCLDMLRSRESRREESLGEHIPEPIARPRGRHRPRARGGTRRLGRSGAAGRARNARAHRTARVRPARPVRRVLRRDRADRGPLADRGQATGEPRAPTCAGRGRGHRRRRQRARCRRCRHSSRPRAKNRRRRVGLAVQRLFDDRAHGLPRGIAAVILEVARGPSARGRASSDVRSRPAA